MSWDLIVLAASAPPPPMEEMPEDWTDKPLGTNDEVRRKISACLPETDWSDPYYGRYEGDGFSCEFSLDRGDSSECVGVRVVGGGEVVPLLRRFEQDGWYLVDASTGEWLHHSENDEAGWPEFQEYRDRVLPARETHVETLPRDLTDAMWWHAIRANAAVPVLLIMMLWTIYGIERWTGYDILRWRFNPRNRDDDSSVFLFGAAIAFSIGGPLVAAYLIQRAWHLARHGVEVGARVTRIRHVGWQGAARIDCEYLVAGQRYTKALSSFSFSEAEEYFAGQKPLILICDPANPRRAMNREDVLPQDLTLDR